MAELEIRAVEERDGPAVLTSFNAVFANGATAPRALAAWNWAYLENPAGRRAWAAFDGERVAAHYAAWPARALLRGAPVILAHVVDSFALPQYRGLAGGNAFARTARAFFDAHGGHHDALYYGWPIEGAWRVGARELGYEAVRTQSALVRVLGESDRAAGETLEVLTHFDEQALWLFERCAPGFSCAVVRDADWLTWRYLRTPGAPATCLGVRDGAGLLRGLAVYARRRLAEQDLGLCVDWLVPEDEPEVGRTLFEGLCARAAAEGAPALASWLPERSAWFARFQAWGARVHPTPWRMAARSFTPRVDAAWLAEDGWFTLGDSDLV